MIEIKNRYTCFVIKTIDADSLRGANLQYVNLGSANLQYADLRDANLQRANLQGANLQGAYLRRANLRSAYLRGADLRSADLRDITVSWIDHTLVSEILARAAKDNLRRQALAGLIRLRTDWCWEDFRHKCWAPDREWALTELRKWVKDGDGAPRWIRDSSIDLKQSNR